MLLINIIYTYFYVINVSRACGGGFCEDCSAKCRPVPERGWGYQPVRVCDQCFEKGINFVFDFMSIIYLFFTLSSFFSGERSSDSINPEITARKVGEVLQNTIGSVVSAIDYPLGTLSF